MHRRPWVLSKLIPSVIPLRHYSLESLTVHKTPWPLLLLPQGPSTDLNSTRESKKGGTAYRRRARSGEGRGWLREFWRSPRGMARRRPQCVGRACAGRDGPSADRTAAPPDRSFAKQASRYGNEPSRLRLLHISKRGSGRHPTLQHGKL